MMVSLSPEILPTQDKKSYPDRITLSETAEQYLNRLGQDLLLGHVELWQLPPSIAQIFAFAYTAGAASRQGEIDQAESDADRFYDRWLNPGKKLAEVRRDRMQAAAAEYWQEFLAAEQARLHTDREAA